MRKHIENIAFYIALITVLITGCADANTNIPSTKEIWEEIGQVVDVSQMHVGDDRDLEELYGIGIEDIDEYVLYTAPSNLEADEIVIIKAKDTKDIEIIREKIAKRVETIGTSFKDYIPEEYHLVEKHIVDSKQNYVIFIVSEKADEIEEVFKNSFK